MIQHLSKLSKFNPTDTDMNSERNRSIKGFCIKQNRTKNMSIERSKNLS